MTERISSISLAAGPLCPAPAGASDRVLLGHGSGGRLSAALVRDHFLPCFGGAELARLGDAAVVRLGSPEDPRDHRTLALSTDSFVVNPLEFPGGNIGTLAVNGTVNDLAMMGARPRWMAAGFIIEEGLPLATLDRVAMAMARAARDAQVAIVAGDTKVVERGKGDGLFINTTGIGVLEGDFAPGPERVRAADAIRVSGDVGVHGMTILAARDDIGFDADLASDTAALWPLVERLRERVGGDVHALRDPTRGGVASAVNEIAAASRIGVVLDESAIPIPTPVAGACEMLGLDPLYVANEGILVAFVAEAGASAALEALRSHPLGRGARRIGTAVADHPGLVVLHTALGGTRIVDLLPGDQLPRIC